MSVNAASHASVRLARGVVLAVVAVSSTVVAAQSAGGAYTLAPQRIGAGGGRVAGGAYELRGTIAQHEASAVLGGSSFELTGGFHRRVAGAPPGTAIFRNGFEGP